MGSILIEDSEDEDNKEEEEWGLDTDSDIVVVGAVPPLPSVPIAPVITVKENAEEEEANIATRGSGPGAIKEQERLPFNEAREEAAPLKCGASVIESDILPPPTLQKPSRTEEDMSLIYNEPNLVVEEESEHEDGNDDQLLCNAAEELEDALGHGCAEGGHAIMGDEHHHSASSQWNVVEVLRKKR